MQLILPKYCVNEQTAISATMRKSTGLVLREDGRFAYEIRGMSPYDTTNDVK